MKFKTCTLIQILADKMCVSAEVRILKSNDDFTGKPEELELLSDFLHHLLEKHEGQSVPVVSIEGNLNVYFRKPMEMSDV